MYVMWVCVKGGVMIFLEMLNMNLMMIIVEWLYEKLLMVLCVCFVNYGFYIGVIFYNFFELIVVEWMLGIKIFIGLSMGDLFVDE